MSKKSVTLVKVAAPGVPSGYMTRGQAAVLLGHEGRPVCRKSITEWILRGCRVKGQRIKLGFVRLPRGVAFTAAHISEFVAALTLAAGGGEEGGGGVLGPQSLVLSREEVGSGVVVVGAARYPEYKPRKHGRGGGGGVGGGSRVGGVVDVTV